MVSFSLFLQAQKFYFLGEAGRTEQKQASKLSLKNLEHSLVLQRSKATANVRETFFSMVLFSRQISRDSATHLLAVFSSALVVPLYLLSQFLESSSS